MEKIIINRITPGNQSIDVKKEVSEPVNQSVTQRNHRCSC